MALQFHVDSLDGLDEPIAKLYTEDQDGGYTLGVDGLPQPGKHDSEDVTGLKAKVAELLAEKKKVQAKQRETEEAARKAAEEAARRDGDVNALEKSWSEKLTNAQAEADKRIDGLNAALRNVLVDKEAARLAGELALPGCAGVLLPHIRARLAVDYVDGQPITRVLDDSGKPSASTLEELKAEFAARSAFAPIIAGSKASGSGAPGSEGGRAAPSDNRSKMTHVQKAAYIEKYGAEAYQALPD